MVQIRVSPQTIFVKLRFDNKRTEMTTVVFEHKAFMHLQRSFKAPFIDQHNFLELQLHCYFVVVEKVALDYIRRIN